VEESASQSNAEYAHQLIVKEAGGNSWRLCAGSAGLDEGLPSFPLTFSFIWRTPIYAAYSSDE
jgi:hypothetical protein